MEKVRGPPHNHYSHKLNQTITNLEYIVKNAILVLTNYVLKESVLFTESFKNYAEA